MLAENYTYNEYITSEKQHEYELDGLWIIQMINTL